MRSLLDAVLSKQPDEVIWDAVYGAVTKSTPPPRPPSSFQQTPRLLNTGTFTNSGEHRKYIDGVLKEELGHLYVGLPGFVEAFLEGIPDLKSVSQAVLRQCKERDAPLYQEGVGWQGWPKDAKESDVLGWFASLIDRLEDFAAQHDPTSRPRRRLLAQPHKPLEGSIAERKMDKLAAGVC